MPEGGFSFSHKKGQTFVPYNGKIADITHADTNQHTLALANTGGTGAIAGETRKIIAAMFRGIRIAGSGVMYGYPNSDLVDFVAMSPSASCPIIIIADGSQTLTYSLTVANDDFDLYCMGYVVEA